MTAEQLQLYFELDEVLHKEQMAFSDFEKPDISWCYLRRDEDEKSLEYSMHFIGAEGRTFEKHYFSKESIDFEVVYQMLRGEFLKTYASDLKTKLKEDVMWAKQHLKEAEDKLAAVISNGVCSDSTDVDYEVV